MVSVPEITSARRPDFLLLGAHPAIDFANTLLPPPGQNVEFLRSWQDVMDWLKAAKLSDGQNLAVPQSIAGQALETVRELRHSWKSALEEIMAGQDVALQFVEELNRFLAAETFSEALCEDGKRGFHLCRLRSLPEGRDLALAIFARSIAEFLITANFKYLNRCANTDSCCIIFYDTTKNHRRQWCSNSMCGNRYKVTEFRRRQRTRVRKLR
jgi:predicted RNA-binding Zn ribbon-like protein